MKRFALIACLLLGFVLPAQADIQSLPYPLVTVPSRCPLSNCTIATGGTAQTVMNANAGVKMICFSNPSTATEPLFFDFGEAANTSTSLSIAPGALACLGGGLIWQGFVSVNAATMGHAFGFEAFQ